MKTFYSKFRERVQGSKVFKVFNTSELATQVRRWMISFDIVAVNQPRWRLESMHVSSSFISHHRRSHFYLKLQIYILGKLVSILSYSWNVGDEIFWCRCLLWTNQPRWGLENVWVIFHHKRRHLIVIAESANFRLYFFLAGGPVIWKLKLQPTVALSSTEAECMDLTFAAQVLFFCIRALVFALRVIDDLVCLFGDNKAEFHRLEQQSRVTSTYQAYWYQASFVRKLPMVIFCLIISNQTYLWLLMRWLRLSHTRLLAAFAALCLLLNLMGLAAVLVWEVSWSTLMLAYVCLHWTRFH